MEIVQLDLTAALLSQHCCTIQRSKPKLRLYNLTQQTQPKTVIPMPREINWAVKIQSHWCLIISCPLCMPAVMQKICPVFARVRLKVSSANIIFNTNLTYLCYAIIGCSKFHAIYDQSECFISENCSYATLKIVYDKCLQSHGLIFPLTWFLRY